MPRTTRPEVQDIFDTPLDKQALESWIEIATEFVDDIAAADSSVSDTRLEKIEKLVAAHLAATQDPRVEKESRDSASASYEGETGMRINASTYGQQAAMLDPTGTLANAGRQTASITVPRTR